MPKEQRPMYVCICAALNEKKVLAAVEAGARSPAAVLRHHGGTLQCGKCVGMIREMVSSCVGDCRTCPNVAAFEADLAAVAANDTQDPNVEYGVAAE
jgi:bacterioferritin-associated ferredoxin